METAEDIVSGPAKSCPDLLHLRKMSIQRLGWGGAPTSCVLGERAAVWLQGQARGPILISFNKHLFIHVFPNIALLNLKNVWKELNIATRWQFKTSSVCLKLYFTQVTNSMPAKDVAELEGSVQQNWFSLKKMSYWCIDLWSVRGLQKQPSNKKGIHFFDNFGRFFLPLKLCLQNSAGKRLHCSKTPRDKDWGVQNLCPAEFCRHSLRGQNIHKNVLRIRFSFLS